MSDHHGAPGLPNETAINTASVAGWVIGTVLVLPLLLAGVDGFYSRVLAEQLQIKVGDVPTSELDTARAAWDAERTSYGVVDAAAGRYRVPLDKARELYLARVQADAAARAAMATDPALATDPAMMPGTGEAGGVVPAPEQPAPPQP